MTGQHVGAAPTPLPVGQYACGRCGIVRPYGGTKKPTKCRDCRDIECVNGHLWPQTPPRNVRGNRRCLLCEADIRARRKTRTTLNQEGTAA